MFSAISATRFAILPAIISYGEGWDTAPLTAPFVDGFEAVFLEREAGVLVVLRWTGADATEAAGMVDGVPG